MRRPGSLRLSYAGSVAGGLSFFLVAMLASRTGVPSAVWAVVPILTVVLAVLGFNGAAIRSAGRR
ncbi:MAG: hypothetical protein Q7W30_08250 [Coriobacteriia bacterium]|nr:hypothetical protein [Coriobacteriia bacterium]